MNRAQFHNALSRATGDDREVIMHRGFNLVDDTSPLEDDDLEALIADWDRVQAEELTSPKRAESFSFSLGPMASHRNRVRMLKSLRAARAVARVRRATETMH